MGLGYSAACSRTPVASLAMNPRLLPFPLNAYAQTLTLASGTPAEQLHFGVFDTDTELAEGYPAAQQRAQQRLLTLLLPPPARVLEIGCGSGTLSRDLAAQGYEVTAITEIEEEWRSACALPGQAAHCAWVSLRDFADGRLFDIVLLQQSSQYLDPLLLFSRAAALLGEGGQLLLADEFLLDDSRMQPEPRPLLSNFLQLAERCGFRVARQRELGRQVAPGLALFAGLLQRYRAELAESLALGDEQLLALEQALQSQAANFATARLGYTLLDLRRGPVETMSTEYGSAGTFTLDEVRPLFERSFEGPFSAAVWQWKYGDGRGRAVGARQHGQLIAHYGGAPRDIRYFGAPARAVQICDVMVLPKHRSFVSRDTLFFKTAATFLEQQIGNCAEHLLGFGFPNARVLKVACRLGLYDITDSFIELRYPREPRVAEGTELRVFPFALAGEDCREAVGECWQRMAQSLQRAVVGVRDLDYLQYRYCRHPLWEQGSYESLAVRAEDATTPVAIVVLKKLGQERLLMDIIGAVQDMPAALQTLRDSLARQQLGLQARITRAHGAALQLPDAVVHELDIEIPCNVWTRGPTAATLAGAWWLTAGDMDFL